MNIIMNLFNKLYYNTWNIGFVERSIEDIVLSKDTVVNVHWVKHNYKDRFFADPFILSVDENVIKVLVEDFPYYDKKGIISLLIINRRDYTLIDRVEILRQPFHMSYPFIQRNKKGEIWVAPEASMSGNLYRYSINAESYKLENQTVLLPEPVLDSTIIEFDNRYWLFCTKRGNDSNEKLYIYYSQQPEGPWIAHKKNPVLSNAAMARPAGYLIKINAELYRVIQKCDKHYGEAINISKIEKLTDVDFKETFIKELRAQVCDYSQSFHTINGFGNICVVDGVKRTFSPLRRIIYEIQNKLK